jgi:FKBP-type peptidyl-prolyl cis-trans isomerase FkpA
MRGFKVCIWFLLASCFVASGCKPKYRQQDKPQSSSYPNQEAIYQSNQSMIRQNAQTIHDQAEKKGWKLKETGTGVFYQDFQLIHKTNAKKIEPGDWVSLAFRLSLLDGTECYNSDDQGLKQFVVEKSEAESGLHEALQFLYPGDSALIVIPPQRAFGLAGDGDRIPPRAILVYEIRVDSVARHPNH